MAHPKTSTRDTAPFLVELPSHRLLHALMFDIQKLQTAAGSSVLSSASHVPRSTHPKRSSKYRLDVSAPTSAFAKSVSVPFGTRAREVPFAQSAAHPCNLKMRASSAAPVVRKSSPMQGDEAHHLPSIFQQVHSTSHTRPSSSTTQGSPRHLCSEPVSPGAVSNWEWTAVMLEQHDRQHSPRSADRKHASAPMPISEDSKADLWIADDGKTNTPAPSNPCGANDGEPVSDSIETATVVVRPPALPNSSDQTLSSDMDNAASPTPTVAKPRSRKDKAVQQHQRMQVDLYSQLRGACLWCALHSLYQHHLTTISDMTCSRHRSDHDVRKRCCCC